MSEMTEHTPLEVLLNDEIMTLFNWAFIESCRADLAQLKSLIEGQQYGIDSAIKRLSDDPEETLTGATVKATETIAQLRAENAELKENDARTIDRCDTCGCVLIEDVLEGDDEYSDPYCPACRCRELSATVTDQARQLAEAREIIEPFSIIGDVFSKQDNHDDSSWTNIPDDDLISCGWKHLTVRIKNFRAASNWIASNPAPQQQDDAQ